MGKMKFILIILLAAALAFAGYFLFSGKPEEEKVKKITAQELPEGALESLEEVRPEIDGFRFDGP